MTRFECDDQRGSPGPHVGCGCRGCYLARETTLDPRLLEMASAGNGLGPIARPSMAREMVRRGLDAYLSGRLDFGALHVRIIEELIKLSDGQADMMLEFANRQATPVLISRKSSDLTESKDTPWA